MRFKKIVAIAAAAVIAVGIGIGVPRVKGGAQLIAITAEAKSSKYPEFPVTKNGDGTVTVQMEDGSEFVGKVSYYYSGRKYSNGEYSKSIIAIRKDVVENDRKNMYYVIITYDLKTEKLSYKTGTLDYTDYLNAIGIFQISEKGDYKDKYVDGDWLIGITMSGEKYPLDYYGNDSDIVLPEGVTSIGVTSVNEMYFFENFENKDTITSITFPKSFNGSIIGFKNFKNLKKVEIKGNAQFDYEAFMGCTSLESVIVKGKLLNPGIGVSAFEDCTSLKTFKIYKMDIVNNALWSLDTKAFKNCKNLTTITLPNNCCTIGSEAFKNCISLETVKISGKWNAKREDGKKLM